MDISKAVANREAIASIKRRYDRGEITRNEAKRLAQPIINRVNSRSSEIAAKYGKNSYPKLDFVNCMRNGY